MLKVSKMVKLEGRVLLFDTISKNRDIFPKTCKINIPEKIPVCLDFDYDKVIGVAEVTKDNKGLIAKVTIIPNRYFFGDDIINEIFEDIGGKIGAGGYFNSIKTHKDENLIIVDEATLRAVSLTLAPACEACYFEIKD